MLKVASITMLAAAVVIMTVGIFYEPPSGWQREHRAGDMHLVSVDPAQRDNEAVYRAAVASICEREAICHVHFWVGEAAKVVPMSDAQVAARIAVWQQNNHTGLAQWLVRCNASQLFAAERKCLA